MMHQPSGVVPHPMDPQQPPPQQPWMMPTATSQPPFQVQPPPQMWAPQQQPFQSQYQMPAGVGAPVTSSDEIRSLWIGNLQYWMDENYIFNCFAVSGEVVTVKVIRNKQTNLSEGYGFIEFANCAAAERSLTSYNGTLMSQTEQAFRLNWATLSPGQKRQDDSEDYKVFVGDLAADVTDVMLQDAFRTHYTTVKGAKVIADHTTGRSKGYGFVRFGGEGEQQRAMTEMNGVVLSTRPMRTGPAADKKLVSLQQKAPYQNAQGNAGESDPNNTNVFVGGLDPSVSDDQLRQIFSPYGELVHVKIPIGKGCGFVQFGTRASAEQALSALNGSQIGSQSVRLSWGFRSPSAKQTQTGQSQAQWNGPGVYYGYAQGYAQDPNMYYANYAAGYGNYQQPQQLQFQEKLKGGDPKENQKEIECVKELPKKSEMDEDHEDGGRNDAEKKGLNEENNLLDNVPIIDESEDDSDESEMNPLEVMAFQLEARIKKVKLLISGFIASRQGR